MNRKVRLVYLDEAGVSNLDQEPYLVVAGFILNADQDWQPLDRHLKSLMRAFLSDELRFTGVFHAKDIWHGSGNFPRDQWPRNKRQEMMRELAAIPAQFHLPIVSSFIQRQAAREWESRRYPGAPPSTTDIRIHAAAFANVARDVDRWMQHHAQREVAMLVAENTGRTQEAIKCLHSGYSGAHVDGYFNEIRIKGYPKDIFESRSIVDTVHFAGKNESPLLQIADTCSFLIKRDLMGKQDTKPLYDLLSPQMISRQGENGWPPEMRQ